MNTYAEFVSETDVAEIVAAGLHENVFGSFGAPAGFEGFAGLGDA